MKTSYRAGFACFLVFVFASGVLAENVKQSAMARPNIILCMADDQGYGDVGYVENGLPVQTPVLDEMARTGLRFDQFYAACPVCSPTRGSVLTGRHPNRFGCFSWGYTLRPEEVTLAEVLKTMGYTTGHFGKWHLGPVRAGNPVSPGGSGFDRWVSSPNFYENSPLLSDQGRVIETNGESSVVTVQQALPFIEAAHREGTPFLAVIWFGNPHTPHQGVPELLALYQDQPERLRNYLAELTGIDRAMGLLRDRLSEIGAREKTLIWYTSDNGARKPGSTGGYRGQKGQIYEGGLRVPGLIEWPAVIRKPLATQVRASTVDIFPTVLDIVGARSASPHPLDGVSLKPVLLGEKFERPKPLGFWAYPIGGHRTPSAEFLKKMRAEQTDDQLAAADAKWENKPFTKPVAEDDRKGHAAWIEGDFKLHRKPAKNGRVVYELYNLADDPRETQDLSAQQPERMKQMQNALENWQKSVVFSLNGNDYRAKSSVKTEK